MTLKASSTHCVFLSHRGHQLPVVSAVLSFEFPSRVAGWYVRVRHEMSQVSWERPYEHSHSKLGSPMASWSRTGSMSERALSPALDSCCPAGSEMCLVLVSVFPTLFQDHVQGPMHYR